MHRLSLTYFHALHQYHGLSHTNAFLVVINLILELFLPRLGITKHLTKHISNKYKFNYLQWCSRTLPSSGRVTIALSMGFSNIQRLQENPLLVTYGAMTEEIMSYFEPKLQTLTGIHYQTLMSIPMQVTSLII